MRSAEASIQSLREDVALQILRIARRSGDTQLALARRLGIPQPTLSKIFNGRVNNLSIELLLRVAIRAGLSLTLQTGVDAREAGVFISGLTSLGARANESTLGNEARQSLNMSRKQLSASERLNAFLEHNQLVAMLHSAGRVAERKRVPERANNA